MQGGILSVPQRRTRKPVRHIKIDEEVWQKLTLLKMFLRKRTFNDVVKQVLSEWEEIKGINTDDLVKRISG